MPLVSGICPKVPRKKGLSRLIPPSIPIIQINRYRVEGHCVARGRMSAGEKALVGSSSFINNLSEPPGSRRGRLTCVAPLSSEHSSAGFLPHPSGLLCIHGRIRLFCHLRKGSKHKAQLFGFIFPLAQVPCVPCRGSLAAVWSSTHRGWYEGTVTVKINSACKAGMLVI